MIGMVLMNFREERAEKRKQDILKTAIKIFKEKGYNDTTIEEIANEMRYTKGSIYYYIPTKEYLLFECHEIAMNMILEKTRPIINSELSPLEKLQELVRKHIDVLIDEMSLLTMALQHEFDLEPEHRQQIIEMRNEYEDLYAQVLEEGVAAGIFKDINLSLTKLAILGALNWIPHWYSKSGPFDKRQIADFFSEYQIAPLLKDSQINNASLSPKGEKKR